MYLSIAWNWENSKKILQKQKVMVEVFSKLFIEDQSMRKLNESETK